MLSGSATIVRNDLVCLRRMCLADLAAFQAYRRDPDVARYQDWEVLDDTKAGAFLSAMEQAEIPKVGGWCQIGIARLDDDRLIGDIGIHVAVDQSAVELGITLSKEAQGRSIGYGAVAMVVDWIFANTNALKIVAITDLRNTAAQALLGRLGWPQVGVLGPDVEIVGLTEFVYEHERPNVSVRN